jgi:hypothetical protein
MSLLKISYIKGSVLLISQFDRVSPAIIKSTIVNVSATELKFGNTYGGRSCLKLMLILLVCSLSNRKVSFNICKREEGYNFRPITYFG